MPESTIPATTEATRVERCAPSELRPRLEALRTEGFALLLDIGGVDYLEREPRFDVVYHLLKLAPRHASAAEIGTPDRVRVLVGAAEGVALPSVADLWPSADWAEREVYDLFGVPFTGHPDLRRIQMPTDWEGHPLRKDYDVRGPANEPTPLPSFASKSNVDATTPPSGQVQAAIERRIAESRKARDSS